MTKDGTVIPMAVESTPAYINGRNRASRRLTQLTLLTTFILGDLLFTAGSTAQDAAAERPAIPFKDALVIPSVGRGGRTAIRTDALQAKIVAGTWKAPRATEKITLPDGVTQEWSAATAAEDGWLRHDALRGGYVYFSIETDESKVMLLEARGHSMVYVNGEPRVGDPYKTGYVLIPVALQKGANDFLFHCRRGELRARLVEPEGGLQFNSGDLTLPDLIVGEAEPLWGAVIVVNGSAESSTDVFLEAGVGDGKATRRKLLPIAPLSIRKVPFQFSAGPIDEPGEHDLKITLTRRNGGESHVVDSATLKLHARKPLEVHKRTFVSEIDGSVQYYAVNPAQPLSPADPPSAMVLTLHGAGVEALGQARAYSPKTWAHIVAPTNRRPFGFDWEDWGRTDAMEVLAHAQQRLKTDPQRTYLTGHSMGGHGAWQVGVTYPDRFAALGPSAGWISFFSYADAPREEGKTHIQRILQRSTSPSETLTLAGNTLQQGIYILHGEADDNVPADEARRMKEHLTGFHHDLQYHEQPGAGHWWDSSDEPGTDCVDWGPMFQMFARHAIPRTEEVRWIDFTTANPEISARSHWVSIEAQIRYLAPSSVDLHYDPGLRRIVGKTDNVARISLDLSRFKPGETLSVELDEQKIEGIPWPTAAARVWLAREDQGKWAVTSTPPPSQKGPHRYGPFKHAFGNRVLFVYGTRGSAEENAWAYTKARYDAETFWYRGNASVDLLPDTAFDVMKEPDRNVILYGHATSNTAWGALLGAGPVQVRAGEIRIGQRTLQGADLACLFLRPRPGSDRATVGVVSGSGPAGMRLTDRLPYFVSGVAYPDLIVLGPETLAQGSEGVRVAGFFGWDWSVEKGEFAWREGKE
jgi:predicted esterase